MVYVNFIQLQIITCRLIYEQQDFCFKYVNIFLRLAISEKSRFINEMSN